MTLGEVLMNGRALLLVAVLPCGDGCVRGGLSLISFSEGRENVKPELSRSVAKRSRGSVHNGYAIPLWQHHPQGPTMKDNGTAREANELAVEDILGKGKERP
ncbi:MAG: hypothetical protein QCH35_07525 [Methanomicrobiaceae archaeon]|nr:hypothetical protein [Methanomicrobiaceae archaeon]